MIERLAIGIIIFCVAVVIGILVIMGRLDIAIILIIICLLAAIPAKWFRNWLWKD